MNQFLPSRYVETIERLALGIEPLDALHGRPLSYQLQVEHEATLAGLRRPPVERHISNRYALRYQPGVTTPLDLRFFDSSERVYSPERDRRRIVPRRLRIPILSLADVETLEANDAQAANRNAKDFKRRIRRPVFFPGAAYDFSCHGHWPAWTSNARRPTNALGPRRRNSGEHECCCRPSAGR